MKYAVIFKVFYWDAFVERQLRRLTRQVGGGDLFILADETNGAIQGIHHDRVIRMTERTSQEEGFLIHPGGNAFWYHRDYQLYHFTRLHPDYEFIVLVEHDCVVQFPIDDIIAAMAAERLDFVGERIREPAETWARKPAAAPYYPPEVEITGRLTCFAAFSRDFVLDLKSARIEHAGRARLSQEALGEDANFTWPNGEALIGCEIARRGARERPLADFGDVSCYNWAPAMPEALLPRLAHCGFVHPVLDTPRFLDALTKINQTPESVFDPNSYLGQIAARVPPAPLLAEILRHFVRRRDFAAIETLRGHAERIGLGAINIAADKPATQSSLSEHSRGTRPAEDAAGALSGAATGRHGFHTGFDDQPWWCLDLEDLYPVREIRISNRVEFAERARDLIVMASHDITRWATLHENSEVFGGADGRPLRIVFPEPVVIRFLRLSLPGRDYLHLDEVEVFV